MNIPEFLNWLRSELVTRFIEFLENGLHFLDLVPKLEHQTSDRGAQEYEPRYRLVGRLPFRGW